MDILECFRYGSRKFNSSCAHAKFIRKKFLFALLIAYAKFSFMLIDRFFAIVSINLFTHHITRYINMCSFVRTFVSTLSSTRHKHTRLPWNILQSIFMHYQCIAFQLDFGILSSHFSFQLNIYIFPR